MLNQERENYFQKALKYDLIAQLYKYTNPEQHIKFYQKHIHYLQIALQTVGVQENPYPYVHTRFMNLLNHHLDVRLNDMEILKNIPPNGICEYFLVPTNTYQLELLSSSNLIELPYRHHPIEITGNDYSTYVITETNVLNFPTEQFLPENETKLRIVHLSNAPAFDVRVKHGDTVFANVSNGVATNYLGLSPMTVELVLTVANSKNILLPLPKLKLQANEIYTLMIVGDVSKQEGIKPLLLKD
ncbi:MAG TPA: DUF4397 domain-containing protein [Pseudoneobacillus sp.]|nr:DUF4397 domain-containing protein [Pseudoneobacillus sp.]